MSADGKTNKPEYTSASLFAAGEEFYLSPIPALTLSLTDNEPTLPKLFGWLHAVFNEASEEGITELRFTVSAVKEAGHA